MELFALLLTTAIGACSFLFALLVTRSLVQLRMQYQKEETTIPFLICRKRLILLVLYLIPLVFLGNISHAISDYLGHIGNPIPLRPLGEVRQQLTLMFAACYVVFISSYRFRQFRDCSVRSMQVLDFANDVSGAVGACCIYLMVQIAPLISS